MPEWKEEALEYDVDAVLRGQGAKPDVIRKRSPQLVKIAERALEEGRGLIQPRVIYEKYTVEKWLHETLLLEGGKKLKSPLLFQHLGPASYIVAIVCTVGSEIDEYISSVIGDDIVYALALDGVGSAAVEALANAACRFFEDEAKENGLQASIPLSPGMIDWDVEDGQPQIFNLVHSEEIGVELNPQFIMRPRKSLSMVQGFGAEMATAGRTCDYCAMRETCRYQDHYEVAHG
jgi:hypothetical protein